MLTTNSPSLRIKLYMSNIRIAVVCAALHWFVVKLGLVQCLISHQYVIQWRCCKCKTQLIKTVLLFL